MKEVEMLKNGGVGVLATDTLYGLVALTFNQSAVERVYTLKERTPSKPCIILISAFEDLALFGANLSEAQRKALAPHVPGPVSFILPCGATAPEYLHRGTHTLAFRIPRDEKLRDFLKQSGPLIAPSANPEGSPPATTIEEARNYFGDRVDFYHDGGKRAGKASTLISFSEHDEIVVLR
jgi:L-threonylcarbamoyladenylate synthase